jgi:hypothetical protein
MKANEGKIFGWGLCRAGKSAVQFPRLRLAAQGVLSFLWQISRNAYPSTIYIPQWSFFNQVQSTLIKVNQGIFQTRMPGNPSLQYSTDSVGY